MRGGGGGVLKYFIQQGRLLKSGSKKAYFKVMLFFLTFYSSKNTENQLF